jgi:hypothetical protein
MECFNISYIWANLFAHNWATVTGLSTSSCRFRGRWQHKLRALWNYRNTLEVSVQAICAWASTLVWSTSCLQSAVVSLVRLTQQNWVYFPYFSMWRDCNGYSTFLLQRWNFDFRLRKVKQNNIQLFSSGNTLDAKFEASMCCHLSNVGISTCNCVSAMSHRWQERALYSTRYVLELCSWPEIFHNGFR